MWRSIRVPVSKYKVLHVSTRFQHSSNSSGGGKLVFGVVAATTAGFAGSLVYGKYNPKFKELLQSNIPYVEKIYKLFPDDENEKPKQPQSNKAEDKKKDSTVPGSLLKKKIEREKSQAIEAQKESKIEGEAKAKDTTVVGKATDLMVSDMAKDLLKKADETKIMYGNAVNAIKLHTKILYEALDLPEGKDSDILWKEVHKAKADRTNVLKQAEEKASKVNLMVEKLKVEVKKSPNSPTVKIAEDTLQKVQDDLEKAKNEVSLVEVEATTAAEYEKLLSNSKEQFRKELQIIVPNYIKGDKFDKSVSESDLNVLIAHAHRRIEQLQKQLAKQKVTEKIRVDEAVRDQKMKDEKQNEKIMETEFEKRNVNVESIVADRIASVKENFETELRKQLRRQAAAHADHIQEVIKIQEQELERKFSLDMEEKLLHQKGVFISETSGNMARLKGILSFLKARSEFDTASKRAQALWLACQAMNDKLSADHLADPCPLGKDVAAVRVAVDEDNEYINSVLAGIPTEAVERGVYNSEVLKERFHDVKKVCRRVALINENSDSLYRYALSYLQSLFVIDSASIPREELDGKVAVDPSEWDTFDVLSRIAFSLKINDLELALRYANQLKGEPRVVCSDWVKEVKLLLETQLAVKALLAHAVAVGVQAYH